MAGKLPNIDSVSSAFFSVLLLHLSHWKKSHFRNLILFSSFPKVRLFILAFYIPLVIPLKSNFSRNISPYWNLSFPTINIQKCVLKSWPLLQTTDLGSLIGNLQDFSATWILREINFGYFEGLKFAVLTIWAALNFEMLGSFDF